MARTSKTRQQLLVLIMVIIAIIVALAYLVLNPSAGQAPAPPYKAPVVHKDFSRSVFDNPEYSQLQKAPIALPLDPGDKGRDNPFQAP